MNCIGLVPRLGVLWWLFLFIIRDNNDEHQVAEFIVYVNAPCHVKALSLVLAFDDVYCLTGLRV